MDTAIRYISRRLFTYTLLLSILSLGMRFIADSSAFAAPGVNEQINFQGRLFNSEGATVPDGFYNMQFKIYSGGDGQEAGNPDGTLLWTEDHLNDNDEGVTIQNGFLSVSLGSINSFGDSIDWNEDTLWLSMNIAGTDETCSSFSNCNPDGEMVPMKRLTSTPYSLNSALLGGIPSSGYVQLAQGVQTDDADETSIHIDKTGNGDLMDLQSNGDDILSLSQTGSMVFGEDSDRSLSVATSSAGSGQSLTVTAGDAADGSDSNGGDLVLQAGSGDGSGNDGEVRVENILAVTDLGNADSDDIVCHNSSNQLADCNSTFATESYVTLQNAYDNDNTIQTSSSSGSLRVDLADDTTDPDFIVDIEAGSSSRFAVSDDGSDVLGVTSSDVEVNGNFTSTGTSIARAGTDGAGTFELQNSKGAALFSLDSSQTSNLAANSGAEDSDTFSTDWTGFDGSGTASISRNDSDPTNIASGSASVEVNTDDAADVGVRNNLDSDPSTDTDYMVSFSARLGSGPDFDDLEVAYSYDGGSNIATCDSDTYNSREITTDDWKKISCILTTPVDSVSDPDLIIRQSSAPGSTRTFYVDNLSMVPTNDSGDQNTGVLRVGGPTSQGLTLLTLDAHAGQPFDGSNSALAGSMYFDTTENVMQCYDGDSWGACGGEQASEEDVTMTPEYPGSVLNGNSSPGVGVMTTDFCSNDADLDVGDLCESGESRNFYRWTSPQSTMQSYSIYVTHELPDTFESFIDSSTIRLTWRTDSTNGEDGTVSYQVFRKNDDGGVTSCDGSNESTETDPAADVWHTTTFEGDETACGFNANDSVIFKINVEARNNSNVYVENLDFTYTKL